MRIIKTCFGVGIGMRQDLAVGMAIAMAAWLACVAGVGTALAESIETVQPGLWNDPLIWSLGRVPASDDDVTINHVVDWSGAGYFFYCRTLTLNGAIEGPDGASGSNAQRVGIYAAYDIVIAGTITSGQGGDGPDDTVVGAPGEEAWASGQAGGDGGEIELMSQHGNIEATSAALVASGDGGNGGSAAATGGPATATSFGGEGGATGGVGGSGGALRLDAQEGNISLSSSATLLTGVGGQGGAATATGGDASADRGGGRGSAFGGDGGDGGWITLDAGQGDIELGSAVEIRAGTGGLGGTAIGTGGNGSSNYPGREGKALGGAGGQGGFVDLYCESSQSGNLIIPSADDLISGGNGGAGGDATGVGGCAGTIAGWICAAGGNGGGSGQVRLYCYRLNGTATPPTVPFLRQVLGGGVGGSPGDSCFVLGAQPIVDEFECGEDLPAGNDASLVIIGNSHCSSGLPTNGPQGGNGYLEPADGADVIAEGYPGVAHYKAGLALAYGGDGGWAEAVTVVIDDVTHHIMIAIRLGAGGDATATGGPATAAGGSGGSAEAYGGDAGDYVSYDPDPAYEVCAEGGDATAVGAVRKRRGHVLRSGRLSPRSAGRWRWR